MMLMLKQPDGLASFAQGQKRHDTDCIRLEKMGGGGRQEMHYLIRVKSRAWRRMVQVPDLLFLPCFPRFGSV